MSKSTKVKKEPTTFTSLIENIREIAGNIYIYIYIASGNQVFQK
jgi:hypothetical protein